MRFTVKPSEGLLPRLEHRPEIDGLRAIAALSVVLFHLNPSLFPGGFIGVDIFFVISGFLIGHQLIYAIERGSFSFKDFYFKRARRIFPAYFSTIFFVFILGLVFSTPDHLMSVSREIFASSFYVSNIYFYLEFFDYFAETAERSALLHTWSLSIEEQIYILLPLALFLGSRFSSSLPRLLIFVTALASLALCIVWTYKVPQLAYFLTPFRAWEFLFGTIGALFVHRYHLKKPIAKPVALTSLAGLLSLLFIYHDEIAFPGFYALVPCLLSLGIIFSCSKSNGYFFLDSSILRFFASVSYSLYLVHWPIIVFAKMVFMKEVFDPGEQVILLLLIITLAYLSYRLIEKPAMAFSIDQAKRVVVTSIMALLGTTSLSAVALTTSGFPNRFSGEAAKFVIAELDHDREPDCYERDPASDDRCFVGDPAAEPNIILLGDSMANRFVPYFDRELRRRGAAGVVVSVGGCPPLFVYTQETREKCISWSEIVMDYINRSPNIRHAVLISRWPSYRDGPRPSLGDSWTPLTRFATESWLQNAVDFDSSLARTMQILRGQDIEVTIVEMFPVFPKPVPEILLAESRGISVDTGIDRSVVEERNSPFRESLMHLSKGHEFALVSFTEAFCPDECLLQDPNGFPTYSDASHPSKYGMEMVLNQTGLSSLIGPVDE